MRILQSKLNLGRLRLDFVISVIVISILINYLLEKLSDFQLKLEQEKVTEQVQQFRLSLTEAWLSSNIQHKNWDIRALENSNPMLLMEELPKNYIGELETQAFSKKLQANKAVWYFDTQQKQLIYMMNNGERIRYKLTDISHDVRNAHLPIGGLDLIVIKK